MEILNNFLSAYILTGENGAWALNPYFVGVIVELILFGVIYFFVTKKPNSTLSVFFGMVYEKVYEFFEDILGVEEKKWTKLYITGMFFVILISNIFGIFIEIVAVGLPFLHDAIHIPTSDINFNVAMAIVGVIIVIYEQFKYLGFGKAIYEYIPVLGKNYIPYERGNFNKFIDWPLFILVKIFDIIISLFLGVLEIIGHGAKIISLSFRLFGNITSGGLLLGMLLAGSALISNALVGFDFPVLLPIILHLQGLLVALIQALVFPLLIAIFIKVAKVH